MAMFRRYFLVLAAVSLSACGSGPSPDEGHGQEPAGNRTPIGKADSTGSCGGGEVDYCGGKSDGNCWCDTECSAFGDCCDDVDEVCSPAPTCATVLCAPERVCVELCAGQACEAKCVPDATCAALFCAPGKTCAPYPGCSGSDCPARCVEPASCANLLCPPGTMCFEPAGCSGAGCQAECLPDVPPQ